MKKTIILCLLAAILMFNPGCGITGGASTVTFSIYNAYGDSLVRVGRVELKRNSDASVYASTCFVPNGSTIEVSVAIPASDNYRVYIQDQYGSVSAMWYAVALTLGNTYSVTIIRDNSTLNSVKRDAGVMW